MKKIIYTDHEGNLCIVIPMEKRHLERVLGPLTEEEYEAHVRERSIPENAIGVRDVEDTDIPSNREFRNAWCDVTEETRIDIDLKKAKDIQLIKLRIEREQAFKDLGFANKLHPDIEEALLSAETKQALKDLRDVTEPLKALEVDGFNDEAVLTKIKELGTL